MGNAFYLVTGCSSGGKSSLLTALAERGHSTVPEPGRRIVADALKTGKDTLPWLNPTAFAKRALDVAQTDLENAKFAQWPVFFDRGVIDAAVGLEAANRAPVGATLGNTRHYSSPVFLAPPWPEIYIQDKERQHGFETALIEYDRLVSALDTLRYRVEILPKTSVQKRVAFVLDILALR